MQTEQELILSRRRVRFGLEEDEVKTVFAWEERELGIREAPFFFFTTRGRDFSIRVMGWLQAILGPATTA